jgi:hypothetical protein
MVHLLSIIIALSSVFFRGWAITLVWKWFIASAFLLPQIDLETGMAIGLIQGFFTTLPAQREESFDGENGLLSSIICGYLIPGFVLFFCYLIHVFS